MNMQEMRRSVLKSLIITIDTEADNQWDVDKRPTTQNSNYIPRFQELAETVDFVPTWLVTYEMLQDAALVSYLKPKALSKKCEIGAHLHAWNNPPEFPLSRTGQGRDYLIEYPEEAMRAKMTCLLNEMDSKFGIRITSHRSGRWALDDRYIDILADEGIIVDCSVTPGVNWSTSLGATGLPGSDYSACSSRPSLLRPGLLEVPMTIAPKRFFCAGNVRSVRSALGEVKRLALGRPCWFRPFPHYSANLLKALLRDVYEDENSDYAMFMIHSSELMPGGSPSFPDAESIERLYAILEDVFSSACEMGFRGISLSDYAKKYFG